MTGKDEKKPKKRPPGTPPRGRPPRHQGKRLSKNRTFRVRGDLDEKLQAAAVVSGRSVSEEIEFRLDQSFDRDAFIRLVLGGDENAKVLQTIAMAMKLESHNDHWLKEVNTVETVQRAANFIIGDFAAELDHLQRLGFVALSPSSLTSKRVAVLKSNSTPEALAYKALQRVRQNVTNSGARDMIWNNPDETPRRDGETK